MTNLVFAKSFMIARILGLSMVTNASDDDSQDQLVGTFARPIDRKPAVYPRRAQQRGQEGWVDVSYVVQPDGTVTDPIVDDSSGIREFENAAIKAVKQWKFEPATVNGKPVEQCHTRTRLTFAFDDHQLVATRNFIRRLKRAQKQIEEGDLEAANSSIDETMERGEWTLYEYARLWFLKAQVAQGLAALLAREP